MGAIIAIAILFIALGDTPLVFRLSKNNKTLLLLLFYFESDEVETMLTQKCNHPTNCWTFLFTKVLFFVALS